ncbi:hypothetical protein BH20ACT2_BH20ACT2_01530 [soil metagenome]
MLHICAFGAIAPLRVRCAAVSPALRLPVAASPTVGPDGRRSLGRAPLAAWQQGETGPLVVALHGLAESSRYWRPVALRLAVDHRVVTVDLLGFGRSPWPDLGYGAEAHADAVAATLVSATGGEPATILAHQAGVPIALAYAARRPDAVRGVVGLGTPWYRSRNEALRSLRGPWWLSRWMVEHQSRARLLCRALCGGRPMVPRIARVFATDTLPADVVEDAFLHHWGSLSGTLESCWTGAALPARYARLPVSLLALHGDDDVAVPVENLQDAAATRSWLGVEVVSGRGFNLALEAPDVVAGVVAELAHRPGRSEIPSVRPAPPIELPVAEAARLGRVHRRTVLSWIEQDSVQARRQGNRLLVQRASLVAHLFRGDEALAHRLGAEQWLSASDAAARLGVSHATVARLADRGLRSYRVAGRRVFLATDLDAWQAR